MYNEKNSCSKFDLTTTIKPIVVFDTEYFKFEVLKDYSTLQGGNIQNDGIY
jgi:hypothetical protein